MDVGVDFVDFANDIFDDWDWDEFLVFGFEEFHCFWVLRWEIVLFFIILLRRVV
jgi:hypothetical protein